MKRITYSVLALVALVCFFTSCTKSTDPAQMVNVTVSFSGLHLTTDALDAKTSDQDANGAGVSRIALKVFDLSNNVILDTVQNKDTDPTHFGQSITLRIPVGSYKFVAVAHTVAETTDVAATINSITEVAFGTQTKYNPTYSAVQDVTLTGNGTNTVSIDFGTRRNALFTVHITDATPSDVQKLQLIVSPTATDYTNLTMNPSTGCAASLWRYSSVIDLADYPGVTTFTDRNVCIGFLLTGATQTADVTINALSSTDATLYTRTLSNVDFQQGHQTKAIGTFFSTDNTSSFVFDITLLTDTISLD